MGNLTFKEQKNILTINNNFEMSIKKNYSGSTPDKLKVTSVSNYNRIMFIHMEVPKSLLHVSKDLYLTSFTCIVKNKKNNKVNTIPIILNKRESIGYNNKKEILFENSFDDNDVEVVVRYDNNYLIKHILIKIHNFNF